MLPKTPLFGNVLIPASNVYAALLAVEHPVPMFVFGKVVSRAPSLLPVSTRCFATLMSKRTASELPVCAFYINELDELIIFRVDRDALGDPFANILEPKRQFCQQYLGQVSF